MKKDYVYQDKKQYKVMQNAEKIGGFLVSDQDVILNERVLPEQRFAHQPIFRRPPEELVATTYYLQYRDFVIATEDTGKKFNGDPLSPLLKVKGLVAYAEPTPEAKTLADKFVQGDVWDNPGYFTQEELVILATYYLNDIGAVDWDDEGQPHPNPSVASPCIFKKHGFYAYQDLQPPDYNQISARSGDLAGRRSLKNTHEVIPSSQWIQTIFFLYQDGNTFGMAVWEGGVGRASIYTADSLEGPWTKAYSLVPNDPESNKTFVSLMQKDCGRLLRRIGYYFEDSSFSGYENFNTWALSFPLFIPGINVGRTGELIELYAIAVFNFSTEFPKVQVGLHNCRMRKKDNGIELKKASIHLKFKNRKVWHAPLEIRNF